MFGLIPTNIDGVQISLKMNNYGKDPIYEKYDVVAKGFLESSSLQVEIIVIKMDDESYIIKETNINTKYVPYAGEMQMIFTVMERLSKQLNF